MEKRPTRQELFLGMAELMSTRGTCQRMQAGAIITSIDWRIISTGYNGPLTEDLCAMKCKDLEKPCTEAIHAERNAIYAAAKHGIALKGSFMYATNSPCTGCAEAIIQAGISEFHYRQDYRLLEGLFLLKRSGVLVYKFGQE